MAVVSIPVAAGQAGVSASANPGISAPSATVAGAGIAPRGTAAAAGDSAPQSWQQSLREAGVQQENSADSQKATAQPHQPAQQRSGKAQPVAHALSLPQALPSENLSNSLASGANWETSNLSSTSRAAQDMSKKDEPATNKDASGSAGAQSLLATLVLPAATAAPSPLASVPNPAKAPLHADGLPRKTDTATLAALPQENAHALSEASATSASGRGQGMDVQAQTNLPSGAAASDLLTKTNGTTAQTPAGFDSKSPVAPEASALSASHPADAAQSAAASRIATPLENAKGLGQGLGQGLGKGLNANAAKGVNAAQAAPQLPDASAAAKASASARAHAERNRSSNPNASALPGAQTASNPAQLSALPVQPVAAANAGVPGSPGLPGSSTMEAASAAGAHSANPFTTLDSSAPAGPATWIHAGTHAAEAGFQDPSLGWVGVRAETTAAGAIHASLLPGSSDAAQALSGHLAGLHAYLSDHHSSVGAVTVARPESAAGWSGFGQQQGQNQNHQQGQQGSTPGGELSGNPGSGAPHFGSSSVGHGNSSSAPAVALSPASHPASGAASQLPGASHTVLPSGGLISVLA